ncbi:hypothetical protein B0H10DRAFT_2290209 [Mycena sp. CBHHK59/15]|nr:hypothetical protein B0H10DRAFT_2290209 [Mycena sp. CBHHK59/15]
MTIYKPCINNYLASAPAGTAVVQCVGAFTTVPTVAQQLWAARLPFWFLQPVEVFDSENIWTVVALRDPMFGLSDPNAHGIGAPPVLYTGNSTEHKIAAINRAAAHTPWYYDPFETTFEPTDTHSRSPSPDSMSVASTSRHPVAAANIQQQQQPRFRPPGRASKQEPRFKPCTCSIARSDQLTGQKAPKPKGPAKIERDKFSALQIPEMPHPSPAWPMHWLSWIELTGMARHTGGTFDQARQAQLQNIPAEQEARESVLRLALDTFDVGSFKLFPVPDEELPEFSLEMIREIVWEVAETSFRFEFCALDRRASGKDRLNEVKGCFAGHMLVGVPLAMSKCGWASTMLEECHCYARRTAILMLDWTTKSPRPDIIRRVSKRLPWSPSQMQELETAVFRYYTQAFWEYFGRPAVVPLRLDHAMEKEDGQL